MSEQFRWYHPKAKANFRKHRVTFAEGTSVFADHLAVVVTDELHSLEEEREIIVGHSSRNRLLLVCFVQRKGAIRLISGAQQRRESRETMKKARSLNPKASDMLPEYRFDYSKARPNRFASGRAPLRTPIKAKAKGNLVEDLVASLHEDMGAKVQRRVRLPSLKHGPKRRREIDVLLTADVAGYPVRLAIECKNERRPIGTGRIDQFIGKLEDIGIPLSQGVFVSPTRYTSAGLQRAQAAGIRPLLLEGLTADRLSVELSEALQSIVYLSATWRQINRFDDVGDEGFNAPWFSVKTDLPRDLGNGIPAVLTHLWLLWMRDEIQPRIGIHHIYIRMPEGFRYSRGEAPVGDSHLIVDLEVVGYVASIAGKAKRLELRHAESYSLEKLRVEAEFAKPSQKLHLSRFETEEALAAFLNSHTIAVQQRIRVPRLISDRFYWPPTMEAIERVQQLKASGEEITFEKVEGSSLARAWNYTLPSTT